MSGKPFNPPLHPSMSLSRMLSTEETIVHQSEPGATLRDAFAIAAWPSIYSRVTSGGFDRVATLAYEAADSMLQAREATAREAQS